MCRTSRRARDGAKRGGYPDEPIVTVHDSLVVGSARADDAERIVRTAWRGLYGIEPGIKRESWSGD
jgi:hypothetical protein